MLYDTTTPVRTATSHLVISQTNRIIIGLALIVTLVGCQGCGKRETRLELLDKQIAISEELADLLDNRR